MTYSCNPWNIGVQGGGERKADDFQGSSGKHHEYGEGWNKALRLFQVPDSLIPYGGYGGDDQRFFIREIFVESAQGH